MFSQAKGGERESVKLALAVLGPILHLLSAVLIIKMFTSRNIQRTVSISQYPQKMTSTSTIYLPGEMMLIQLGIKTQFLRTHVAAFDCKVLTTKHF